MSDKVMSPCIFRVALKVFRVTLSPLNASVSFTDALTCYLWETTNK